ncbi:MAG: PH domain-containing protein [Planctomycetota bacterium]
MALDESTPQPAEGASTAASLGGAPGGASGGAEAADPYRAEPEAELWKGSPSQWTNIGWFALCVLVIPIPWAIYQAIKTASTDYVLTTQRLRMKDGILNRRTEEIELYRVRDTALHQSLFERIFGLGTIDLTSSDPRTPEVNLRGIKGADGVREHFRIHTEKMRRSRGVRDIDMS